MSARLLAILLLGLPALANASEAVTTRVLIRHVDSAAHDPQAVRRLLRRLDMGARTACGAGPESLREWRIATARSRCWHDAMVAALRQIGNPALDAAFAAREK